eukprot:TRINITY_DN1109_c0_g3_i2.p1 TRINITY_DN1109_c0_g3~~TRINITY_DN1109_c0_g3_i2.p1  ORF type:complete len:363 (-),score=33.68 TRINITY_DN1109_c0_g3_i2:13-969(-)
MSKLSHPFCVTLRYAFQTHQKIYMAYDYIDGRDLFFHLQDVRVFTLEIARFLIAEICLAVEYFHSHGIVHKRIKPEGFLLTSEGHIVLLGCGEFEQLDGSSDFCGTPEYLAPEIIMGESYGKAVDWWAVGNILFEMLTGLPPFYSQDIQQMYSKILYETLVLPDHVDKDASALLHKLLTRDPTNRLQSLEKIKAEPFFADTDWDAIFNKTVKPPYIPPPKPPSSDQITTTSPDEKKQADTEHEMWSDFYYDYRLGLYGWSPSLHKKLHPRVQKRAITFLLVHHRYETDKTYVDHPLCRFGAYLIQEILQWINPPPHDC